MGVVVAVILRVVLTNEPIDLVAVVVWVVDTVVERERVIDVVPVDVPVDVPVVVIDELGVDVSVVADLLAVEESEDVAVVLTLLVTVVLREVVAVEVSEAVAVKVGEVDMLVVAVVEAVEIQRSRSSGPPLGPHLADATY